MGVGAGVGVLVDSRVGVLAGMMVGVVVAVLIGMLLLHDELDSASMKTRDTRGLFIFFLLLLKFEDINKTSFPAKGCGIRLCHMKKWKCLKVDS